MFPALHSTRSELVTSIRANAGQIQGAKGAARFRATLVTAQIALSTGLLISARPLHEEPGQRDARGPGLAAWITSSPSASLLYAAGTTAPVRASCSSGWRQELAGLAGRHRCVRRRWFRCWPASNWGTDVDVAGIRRRDPMSTTTPASTRSAPATSAPWASGCSRAGSSPTPIARGTGESRSSMRPSRRSSTWARTRSASSWAPTVRIRSPFRSSAWCRTPSTAM